MDLVNQFTKIARKAANIQIQQNKHRNINLKLFPKLNANPQIAVNKLTKYNPSFQKVLIFKKALKGKEKLKCQYFEIGYSNTKAKHYLEI